jgi:hypothetical protein
MWELEIINLDNEWESYSNGKEYIMLVLKDKDYNWELLLEKNEDDKLYFINHDEINTNYDIVLLSTDKQTPFLKFYTPYPEKIKNNLNTDKLYILQTIYVPYLDIIKDTMKAGNITKDNTYPCYTFFEYPIINKKAFLILKKLNKLKDKFVASFLFTIVVFDVLASLDINISYMDNFYLPKIESFFDKIIDAIKTYVSKRQSKLYDESVKGGMHAYTYRFYFINLYYSMIFSTLEGKFKNVSAFNLLSACYYYYAVLQNGIVNINMCTIEYLLLAKYIFKVNNYEIKVNDNNEFLNEMEFDYNDGVGGEIVGDSRQSISNIAKLKDITTKMDKTTNEKLLELTLKDIVNYNLFVNMKKYFLSKKNELSKFSIKIDNFEDKFDQLHLTQNDFDFLNKNQMLYNLSDIGINTGLKLEILEFLYMLVNN